MLFWGIFYGVNTKIFFFFFLVTRRFVKIVLASRYGDKVIILQSVQDRQQFNQ